MSGELSAWECREESLRLCQTVGDVNALEDRRNAAFERLLALPYGFWQQPEAVKSESLRAFALKVSRWAIARLTAIGTRPSLIADEDIAQEVLWVFYQNAHQIRTNPRSWMIGVAIRTCRVVLRREYTLALARSLRRSDQEHIPATSSQVPYPGCSFEKLESGELFDRAARGEVLRLRAAIGELSPKAREVFQRVLLGLATNEIAAEMRVTQACVRQHLSRGRRHLAGTLIDGRRAVASQIPTKAVRTRQKQASARVAASRCEKPGYTAPASHCDDLFRHCLQRIQSNHAEARFGRGVTSADLLATHVQLAWKTFAMCRDRVWSSRLRPNLADFQWASSSYGPIECRSQSSYNSEQEFVPVAETSSVASMAMRPMFMSGHMLTVRLENGRPLMPVGYPGIRMALIAEMLQAWSYLSEARMTEVPCNSLASIGASGGSQFYTVHATDTAECSALDEVSEGSNERHVTTVLKRLRDRPGPLQRGPSRYRAKSRIAAADGPWEVQGWAYWGHRANQDVYERAVGAHSLPGISAFGRQPVCCERHVGRARSSDDPGAVAVVRHMEMGSFAQKEKYEHQGNVGLAFCSRLMASVATEAGAPYPLPTRLDDVMRLRPRSRVRPISLSAFLLFLACSWGRLPCDDGHQWRVMLAWTRLRPFRLGLGRVGDGFS